MDSYPAPSDPTPVPSDPGDSTPVTGDPLGTHRPGQPLPRTPQAAAASTPRRVTIAQVARHAGVGVGTVSRVLNEHPSVLPATRERVRAAIAELDYRPSPLARSLKHGRTQRIAVLVSFFTNPSAVERLRGLTSGLAGTGYELVLYPVTDDEQRRAHLDSLTGPHQAEGVVLISLPLDDVEVERLQRASVGVVQLDAHHDAFTAIAVDDQRGGALAAQHLLELSHRSIGFVGDPEDTTPQFVSSRDRRRGFETQLRQAGVADPARWVRTGRHGVDTATVLAHDLLDAADRPSAVFAASDTQAFGVMRAARQLGLRVPDDVSVLGFDDIDAAEHVGLTTVRQPLEDSGRLAAELLLHQLQNPAATTVQRHLLPLEIVVRGTTGPARLV